MPEYFERDSTKMGGELVFRGTRLPVRTVIASLRSGDTPAEIMCDFPVLNERQLAAAVKFAGKDR